MKKVIFSAIAMIAFVGSSMAKGEVLITLEMEQPVEREIYPCFKTAMKMMDLVEADMGVIDDIVEYNTIYQYYVGACESGLINLD